MTHRNLQRQEDIPAVCENENCENFKAFELYDVTEIKEEEDRSGYVICYLCKQKIYVD
jgi:hypothetical protein